MTELQKYKWATAILGVLVLFLGISWLKNGANSEVRSALSDAAVGLEQCNAKIATWREANPTRPASAEAQEELADILQECSSNIQ